MKHVTPESEAQLCPATPPGSITLASSSMAAIWHGALAAADSRCACATHSAGCACSILDLRKTVHSSEKIALLSTKSSVRTQNTVFLCTIIPPSLCFGTWCCYFCSSSTLCQQMALVADYNAPVFRYRSYVFLNGIYCIVGSDKLYTKYMNTDP